MPTPAPLLSPVQFKKLVCLNAKLCRVLGFEAVPVNRDARTGTFTGGALITSKGLRAAWGLGNPNRDADRDVMKKQLLTALRAPRE